MINRNDLTQDEWDWLVRINRHDAAFLTVAMDHRLKELGLVQAGLGGAIVTRAGRELLAKEFAPIVRARKKRQEQERLARDRLMAARRGR